MIRVGVIGMGGFAGVHHDAVRSLEEKGSVRLVCTCDPAMDSFGERRTALDFERRDVRTFTDYRDMLKACGKDLDLVTIPTPIPLHEPMHRACIDAGIPVYLEKPPTLSWAELDAMAARDVRVHRETNVGFNFIVEPPRLALKARLADGEFGAVRRIRLRGLAPRPTSYYGRAAWAGRLSMGGSPVLDSPMGNAMAHYVHDGLFWGGQKDLWAWGGVESVKAELYRAHAIEGADTVFVTARLEGGVELRVGMTHACTGGHRMEEDVECAKASIRVSSDPLNGAHQFEVRHADGRRELLRQDYPIAFIHNFEIHLAYLRGERSRPVTRLEDSRPFVAFNILAYVAAGTIGTVSQGDVEVDDRGDRGRFVAIRGIGEAVDRFVDAGEFPGKQGAAWAAGATGEAGVGDLHRLADVIKGMTGC